MQKNLIAAWLMACIAGSSSAQISRDVQELNQAHQNDEDARYAIPERPRPAHSQKQEIHRTRQLWTCAGIDPWQNVYASPAGDSQVIGVTQPQIAISGERVNGFLPVLFYNGTRGYVPASSVHIYVSPTVPGVTCTFVGLNDQNRPMFRFDPPASR